MLAMLIADALVLTGLGGLFTISGHNEPTRVLGFVLVTLAISSWFIAALNF